jgi:17beta-estradiol 17-dehydrogenase / very-long-chain 3-oxoacyl-CoA reductase
MAIALTLDGVLSGLGALGLLYLLVLAVRFIATLHSFFFRAGKRLRDFGEWAVVTGATDGIGRAYAFELARQGLSVLLVSRTEAKLVEMEKEIREKYPGVTVDHLAVDYSNFDAAAREVVRNKVASMDVGVLINNVGMSYPFARYFHELKDEEIAGIVELNVNSTVWMTRIVLGDESSGMVQRRRGAIVNTSSGAGRATSPLLAEYSGAKSFIEMFSRGLKAELASYNIHVQAQAPLFVATKLAKIRKTSLSVPSPAAYARVAAARIGFEDSVSPWWSHALQLWALRQLPEQVVIAIGLKMHLPIRKAGMKKEAQRAEEAKKGQ